MFPKTDNHRNPVRNWLQMHPDALVALSGGVDSALLAVLAKKYCNRSACICVRSCFLPESDFEDAVSLASKFGLELHLVDASPLADEAIRSNPEDRCFFCKNMMVNLWRECAGDFGLSAILCGDNRDDRSVIRPGKRALDANGILAPFDECGLSKEEIRLWAKELDIPIWNKAPSACLASRIPFGTEIHPTWLKRIDAAEMALKTLGLNLIRIRAFQTETSTPEARIETDPALFDLAEKRWYQIILLCKQAGFVSVTLDPAGYRCGNLHSQQNRSQD